MNKIHYEALIALEGGIQKAHEKFSNRFQKVFPIGTQVLFDCQREEAMAYVLATTTPFIHLLEFNGRTRHVHWTLLRRLPKFKQKDQTMQVFLSQLKLKPKIKPQTGKN